MDYIATAKRHRPEYCASCGSPKVHRHGYRKYVSGAVSFYYSCRTCHKETIVKLYDIPTAELEHKPGAVLKILSVARIDQLIRSVIGDYPDGVQDAWLSVIASPIESEDDVLAVTSKILSKRRSKFIKEEHTLRSLDTPIGDYDDPDFTLSNVLADPTDVITEVEGRVDAEHPVKPSLKVRIDSMRAGEELDLSSVPRVDVARAVCVVPEHISQIFMGKAEPSLPLAYDIAKYLNTTVDYLYKAISGANGSNPNRMKHNRYHQKVYPKKPIPAKNIIKVCPTCDITFQTNNPLRIYHNQQCATRAVVARMLARRKANRTPRPPITRTCPWCQQQFTAETPRSGVYKVYCSAKCQGAGARYRNRPHRGR